MLLYNYTNPNQSKKPSEMINFDQIYEAVISEQPDQENLQNEMHSSNNVEQGQRKNKPKLTIKRSLKYNSQNEINPFSVLTQTEKAIEIQKIYEQSELNSFILEMQGIIEQQKQNLNYFIQKMPQRKRQLQIYVQKLQSLSDMLKQSMGTTTEIKIYMSKKVLMILKSVNRFKQPEQYNILLKKINNMAGIKEEPLLNTHQKTLEKNENQMPLEQTETLQNHQSNTIKNQIRRKKRSMTLSLRLQNKPQIQQNQQPVTFWRRVNQPLNNEDLQFQQILQKVDSIHQKHLKNWFQHNNQLRQLEDKRKQIKSRYLSLQSKKCPQKARRNTQNQYGRVNKFFSLFQGRQNNQPQEEQQLKQCFQTLDNQVSRRLSYSLPSLHQNNKKSSTRKQNQTKLKVDLDPKVKKPKQSLKLLRPLKRNSSKESKENENERKQNKSQKNLTQISKNYFDQIIQPKKRKSTLRRSTQISDQSNSKDKTNSGRKMSNFRNLSPLPNNNNKKSQSKLSQNAKNTTLKTVKNSKSHKLKIV